MKAFISIAIFIFLLGLNTIVAQINADFSSPNLEACGNLQTTFFDQSTSDNSIISWSWNLGGNTSSKQNPGAIFTEPGKYTICLTVTDVAGNSDTECKEDYIIILANPTSNFEADNTEGCAPISVNFTDLSVSENGSIVSWLWDIGGSTGVVNTQSADEAIFSNYTTGGQYTTSLTIEDSLGCTSTTTISNFIHVYQIPEADVDFNFISSCQLPWQIEFFNNNSDSSVTYIWDFGNGTTFEGNTPPIVTYSEIGQYDIQLFMSSGDCMDTLTLESYIDTDVTAEFSYSPSPTCQNASIQFIDESIQPVDSVVWSFGDGESSTAANPIHVYKTTGCFDVTLIRFSEECIDTATLSCIEVFPIPEVEIEIENQFNCTLPTTVNLKANTSESGSFQWEFIGGPTPIFADSNNVPIQIESFGSYFVNLTFTNLLGCEFTQDSIPIDIYPFEAFLPNSGPSGCVPLSVTLSDSIISQFDITSWEWSIGEPALFTSNSENPTFTFQDTGRYDVQLIVENINGCQDTIVIEDYIKVGMVPEVNFEAIPVESCISDEIQFIDLSSNYVNDWVWYYDTIFLSNNQNPLENIDQPGVYDISLLVSHNGCYKSLLLEDYLTIFEPLSRFGVEYNCEDPYTVTVNNSSVGADSLSWTLRLSETDSLIFSDSIFGQFTFPDRGNYTLTHYSKNFESGCEHIYTDTIKIVDPIASYTLDTLTGCAPLEINIGDYSQDAFAYEYLTDDGTIDSIFTSEPTIVFTEGGVINGPLLIITDIHECKDSFQLMDSVIVNRLDASINFPEVICVPDVAELEDTSTDALGNVISWSWSIGGGEFESSSQDTSIYIDSVGMYDLLFKVIDDWGCEDSLTIPNAINAVEIIPDFVSDTLGCTRAPIAFEAKGDNGFVSSYSWDFGDGQFSDLTNPNHIYEAEGTYTVCLTMGDSRGCGKTICKENIITIIDPNANFDGDPIFATCPPLLTTMNNLSTDAISYIWDFGDNSGISKNESPSHVYTSPGAYDVMLIAQSTSNCFDTLLLEDYVRVEGPTGDFTLDITPSCIPISVELLAQSDGFYSYTWDYGNGVLDSVAGLVDLDSTSFVYTETGSFTPKLIITDSIGCSRSFAGDPIIVNDVNLDFTKDFDPQCGPPLDVSLYNLSNGTTSDIDFSWFLDGPENLSSLDSSPVFTILQSGVYSVNLVAEYDLCKDTLSKVEFLEIADIPNVSFEVLSDQFCENISVEFLNTSSVGYGELIEWHWDFGDGQISNLENPSHQYSSQESQTITLTGITDKGCEAQSSISFDVLPSMIGNAGEDQLICIGDQVQLNSSINQLLEGGTFYWEGESSLSCLDCFNPIVNPQTTSSYVFVSIHPNGCESRDTMEVEVIPTPGPELSLSSDSIICLGSESIINVDNYSSSYNYIWNSNIQGQDCYIDCEQVTISPDSVTTYYVTVFNEFGCFKSDSVTIDVESSFVEFIPPSKAICEGESTIIEVAAGNNPMWFSDPDISCNTCTEIEVAPTSNKKYYLVVESDLGCKYLDSVYVLVIPDNSVYAGSDQEICSGEFVELSAVGIGQPVWSPTNIMLDSLEFITKAQPEASGYITLTMTNDECTQTDSLFVEVYDQAEIVAMGDSICAGEPGILLASGRADSYSWEYGESFSDSEQFETTAEETQVIQVIGTYRSCIPDTAEAVLYVYPNVDYLLEETNYTIHLNDEIWIQPSYDSTRNYQFEWSPSLGLDCTDCPDPMIQGIMENMEYALSVIDLNSGCKGEYQINVRFQNDCTQNVFFLPNIFTPSSNNANSIFKLSTKNPEEFISMTIYDRWGNQLFYSSDIDQGWNGMTANQDVESGVYVYKIDLVCPITNENYVILGDITVIH